MEQRQQKHFAYKGPNTGNERISRFSFHMPHDFEKIFDRVQHNKVLETLKLIVINAADRRIIKNLYTLQTIVVDLKMKR